MTFDIGPEPTWLTCTCGELSSRVPCWNCDRAAQRVVDVERERVLAGGSIPRRYDWAKLGASDLDTRVKSKHPVGDIAKRVLGATRVVFAGPSGSGKTSLACACLRERLPHGLFLSTLRLGTARIQHHAGDGEAGIVQRAMTAPLLLLDEVGGEVKTATNATRDVLFARYEDDLPTWITTGFSLAQLAEMYGDGMSRRISEDAYIVRLGVTP